MRTFSTVTNNLKLYILSFLSIICITSCNPIIHSFTAEPLTTTSRDSIKVNWDVAGKPTLFFHELESGNGAKSKTGEINSKYLEFVLSVQKGNKEVHRMIQVTLVPDTMSTEILFSTTLHGDTLIASGVKNILRWGKNFEVLTVTSDMKREMLVSHFNKTVVLNSGTSSNGLEGTLVDGSWEFRTLLTQKEKADLSTAPDRMRITVLIHYKKETPCRRYWTK